MSDIQTRLHLNRADKTITAERVQDCEPILNRNAELRGQSQKSDWGRHVASIPCIIIERWLREEHAAGNVSINMFSKEFDALVARKLRDPDWRWLRVDK